MRKLSLILMLLVVGCFTLPAHANTDPRILMDDPTCSEGATTYNAGTTASFTANSSGGGFFQYCIGAGSAPILTVDVRFNNTFNGAPIFANADIVCSSTTPGFTPNCVKFFNGDGTVDLVWTAVGEGAGYQPGTQLSFNLNNLPPCDGEFCPPAPTDPNGTGGWLNPDGSPITMAWAGSATTDRVIPNLQVPEPASILLFGTGLLGVWQIRRRRK